jgi:hypothetical protein
MANMATDELEILGSYAVIAKMELQRSTQFQSKIRFSMAKDDLCTPVKRELIFRRICSPISGDRDNNSHWKCNFCKMGNLGDIEITQAQFSERSYLIKHITPRKCIFMLQIVKFMFPNVEHGNLN